MENRNGALTHRIKSSSQNNTTLHMLIDTFIVIASLFLGLGRDAHLLADSTQSPTIFFILLIYTTCILFFFSGFEMYSVVLFRAKETFITVLLSCLFSLIGTFVLYSVVFRSTDAIGFLLTGAGISFAGLVAWREMLFYHYLTKKNKPKLLIIENLKPDNSRIRRMKYACLDKFQSWYEQVDTEHPDAMKAFIEGEFPKYDAVCLMESIPIATREMIQNAVIEMDMEFYVVPAMYELSFSHVRLTLFDDVMVFHVNPDEISSTAAFLKRLIDLVFSVCILVLAAIPMAIIALLIKLTSPGPVFYKQVRLTRNKREFNILKFRSMVPDAEKATGPVLAEKDDPRITKIGRLLRATRLDELPQLINILKGDMSIVGPRPERPFFVEQFEKEIPNYHQRFLVKAGLTSLSHVYGRYSTDIRDRTLYDLLYLKNFCLKLDMRIILLTTRIICLNEAAEGVSTFPTKPTRPTAPTAPAASPTDKSAAAE